MKVGEYARLKNGYIDKIEELKLQTKYTKYNKLLFEHKVVECLFSDEDLKEIKSSPNIMDLIEENDYIRTINDTDFRRVYMSYGKLVIEKHGLELSIKKLKLAEIITSQQFPQMKYKVESEAN